MKVYVVIANYDWESCEKVIGVYSNFEKAEAASINAQLEYDYATITDIVIDA